MSDPQDPEPGDVQPRAAPEPDDPPTPEEERAAQALRVLLEQEDLAARPGGAEAEGEAASLRGAARLIAQTQTPPLGDLARERVRKALLKAEPARSAPAAGRTQRWLLRTALAASVLIVGGGVAALVFDAANRSTPQAPPIPYAAVFSAPFDASSRPVERLEQMIAWRQGSVGKPQ